MYPEGVMRWLLCTTVVMARLIGSENTPKFDAFRVATQWNGPNVTVKLIRHDERMFRTHLSRGAKERPNFAGHYDSLSGGVVPCALLAH